MTFTILGCGSPKAKVRHRTAGRLPVPVRHCGNTAPHPRHHTHFSGSDRTEPRTEGAEPRGVRTGPGAVFPEADSHAQGANGDATCRGEGEEGERDEPQAAPCPKGLGSPSSGTEAPGETRRQGPCPPGRPGERGVGVGRRALTWPDAGRTRTAAELGEPAGGPAGWESNHQELVSERRRETPSAAAGEGTLGQLTQPRAA